MPGTAPGTCGRKHRNVAIATSSTGGPPGARFAGEDHVGLEQHALERDTLVEKRVEHCMKNKPGDLFAALDRVRPVHKYFRLDDRCELLLLTKSGVARRRVCVRADAGRTRQSVSDTDDGRPLGKASTHGAVFRQAISQTVKSLRDGLVRRAGNRLRARVRP